MDEVGEVLRNLFSYILYPLVIMTVFFGIINAIHRIIKQSQEFYRCLTAAILPIVILVFIIVLTRTSDSNLEAILTFPHEILRLLVGLVVGWYIEIIGRRLMQSDKELGPTLLILLLSSIASFLLYAIMIGNIDALNYYIFGAVVGWSLAIILKGWSIKSEQTTHTDSND